MFPGSSFVPFSRRLNLDREWPVLGGRQETRDWDRALYAPDPGDQVPHDGLILNAESVSGNPVVAINPGARGKVGRDGSVFYLECDAADPRDREDTAERSFGPVRQRDEAHVVACVSRKVTQGGEVVGEEGGGRGVAATDQDGDHGGVLIRVLVVD